VSPMGRKTKRPQKNARIGRRLQWGPLTATEVGNEIVLESNWTDPEEHAAFLAKRIADKPRLKDSINKEIDRAKQIITAHDPIELLTLLSIECAFTKIRETGEEEPAQDFAAEYAL